MPSQSKLPAATARRLRCAFRRYSLPSLGFTSLATLASLAGCGSEAPGSDSPPPPAPPPMVMQNLDCPAELDCEVIPAAHRLIDPKGTDYGNYDLANRPTDGLDIRYIVIHDTDASYDSTIATFQNPSSKAAAHYLVRSSDGHIVNFVAPQHVAWHAGNWYYNMHSVGIEHIGFAHDGYRWYSETMYQASARLVRHLAKRYGVPLDRAHIFGHEEVPGTIMAKQKGMHWDPGPYWDWDHYMQLVRAGGSDDEQLDDNNSGVVAIRPRFADNQPPMTYCFSPDEASDCRPLPLEPANFVPLRTAPDPLAPFISNPYLTWPGDRVFNWGTKAATGRRYFRSERQGDWDAIDYGGQKVWFENPGRKNTRLAPATLITARAGLSSVPVYGVGYPSAAAFLPPTTPQTIEKIYDLPAGQRYVSNQIITGDYYWAKVFADTLDGAPYSVVKDSTAYYQIEWNHRSALVRATDVEEVSHP